MRIHIAIKQSQIGEFLPFVTRHSSSNGFFAINYFIVGKRQHEIFRKSIRHRKSQIILMVFSIHRIFLEIFQGIMHPSHHPFHPET